MELYLSASGIKDFLSCSKRYYYRRYHKDKSATSDPMSVGNIVHYVIENEWKDEKIALELARKEELSYNISTSSSERVRKLIKKFYRNFSWMLSDDDKIEMDFKIPYADGVYIIGKIDRITTNNIAIDWKTGSKDPYSLSHDPQFILYNWAYKKLYGKPPERLIYASLTTGATIDYKHYTMNEDILMNNIIPHMIDRISKGDFLHDGKLRFGYTCTHCNFKEFCWDELVSGDYTFKPSRDKG